MTMEDRKCIRRLEYERAILRQVIRDFLQWENNHGFTEYPIEEMLEQTEKLAAVLPESKESVRDQITQHTPSNQE